jgi:hypothetical protein
VPTIDLLTFFLSLSGGPGRNQSYICGVERHEQAVHVVRE